MTADAVALNIFNMCTCTNACSCDNLSLPFITGPQGPAGPSGTNGTNGTNGSDGNDGAAIIDMLGPQTPLVYATGEDKTLDFLTIPANTLNVGDKLEIIFLVKVATIVNSGLYQKVSVSSSITNTAPTVGGSILSPFAFIGPVDAPKNDDVYTIRYQISRLATSTVSIEGDYRLSPAPVSGVAVSSVSSVTRTIYNYITSLGPNLSNAFYVSFGIGLDDTSLVATLLYASAELKTEL